MSAKARWLIAYWAESSRRITPPANHPRKQLGILTNEQAQVIFMDTPGLHKPVHKLGEYMNAIAALTLQDADLILWLVAVDEDPTEEDRLVAEKLAAALERGVKGDLHDVILVGADDWHATIAATPLAIWSLENQTRTLPLLILPKSVQAGDRNGWVEESDLHRYGASAILGTFKAANISTITIHGTGDQVRILVEAAHKDGLKAYITATLEIPVISDPEANGDIEELPQARKAMLAQAGLDLTVTDETKIDKSLLQVADPDIGGNATHYCPANQEARDNLYNLIETLVDDYKADGVVLYNFGFQDENYCYCNVCKEKFYQDTGIDLSKVNINSYNQERWTLWKQDQLMMIVNYAEI